MSIPPSDPSALSEALDDARALVGMGVPVFAGRLDKSGDPYTLDPRWKSWQRTRPNSRPLDRYARGEALGALTGHTFDVIDIDPRNGGRFSFKRLAEALGDDGPEVWWEVQTSSGGRHIYISPLGIGTHPGFLPGLDLKAEGGFVFIPPTVRPSKASENAGQMVAYTALQELKVPIHDGNVGAIRDYIESAIANKRGRSGKRGAPRSPVAALEAAALKAGAGEQHDALRALVDEWARVTGDDDLIVDQVWRVAQQMTNFQRGNPWTERDIRGLLHRKERRPVPDATRAEKEDLGDITVRRTPKGLQAFADVEDALTRWWWRRYGAIGDMTMLDGDAGLAKSLLSLDLGARFTRALPMPGESENLVGQGNVLILAPEDRAEVIKARMAVHGADMTRVFRPHVSTVGSGKTLKAVFEGSLLTFPDKVDRFARWIEDYEIGLVICDPVAAFLSKDVNTANDASVRSALEPFGYVLQQNNAGAFLIRHLNKQSGAKASYRGGGSVAFGAVARVHLLAGKLPEEGGPWPGGAEYAVAQLKNNHLKRIEGEALAYRVVDSSAIADEDGSFVPRIEWCGVVDVDVDVLANGVPARRGPAPSVQPLLAEFLEAMFAEKDTWPASAVKAELRGADFSLDHKTIDKVRAQLGIRSVQAPRKRGKPGVSSGWLWTTAKPRVGDDDA